jgi:hypothetical protein
VAQEEEVLKADSGAVVSAFQPGLAFIGRRLSDAKGKPTALFRFHQIFAVVFARGPAHGRRAVLYMLRAGHLPAAVRAE